ncbi:MAG: hypothetical protein H7Y13_00885, partial [Sphingobacteriaceae bacterium]|nr:hypothetical protein [Sphingobacteriaceae bacterium]
RASSWTNVPLIYINELNAKYTQWARKTLSKIEIKALEKEGRVTPGKNLSLLKPSEFGAASKLRFHTEAKFLVQTEGDFYTEMYDYLKRELGVKSLIAANSDCDHYYNGYALLSNLSKFDYIDGHAYWHIYDDSGKELYGRKDNIPMVTLPQMSNPVKLSRSAVQGKPYTVSEINNGNYNDYYSEGVPLTGAYSALQDWDGVFYFTLSHTSANNWNTFYPGGLDLVVDPIRMANMASSGLMYRRSDIQPSGSTVLRGYNQNDMIEGLRDTLSAMPFYTKNFNQLTPLIQKTRIASFTEQINDFPKIKDETKITSETGELTWHNKYNNSFVEVSTPNSEALIGFLPQSPNLKHLQAKLKNDFGSITITSLDGKALHSAEKILLVTTARAGMKGMKWTEGQTKLLERGGRPTTIEVVSGEISLSGLAGAKSLIIEPLDGAGNPLRSITRTVENGKVIFPVGEDVTVWYYLTVKR